MKHMTARLSDDLVLELERVGDEPLPVENPRNHKLYLIIAADRFPNGKAEAMTAADNNWTEEQNARRFVLIDKDIDGTISPSEAAELDRLQHDVDNYLRRVAPLPLAAARQLHEQLRRSLGNSDQA